MKRILLAVAVLAFLFPAVRQAEAADISIDFFYDNIGDDGSWVEVADYGYCWQPSVAVSNRSWRPYTDGYWAYTDVGWTWVSYEDFGWATYHYGRWVRLRGRGWIWVPGREWGPAWVSWRTGGDYVGWAPLPPRGGGDVIYDSRPITAQVDIDFDIGPLYYNFIDVRYIGEPVLRERIFASEQNVTYITKTVNVTNITYRDNQVYNYGPDYNTLSRYSTRPIQRLNLQRETSVDPLTAVRSRSVMKVEGNRLVIAAPQTLQKPSRSIAPKVVKEKIAQTPLERGWEGVSDQKAQAELKQKMKSEDPKTVSPPSVQPVRESAASPAASAPATSTASATPATGVSPAASASATSASPAVSASVSPAKGKDKDKGKKSDISPAPSVAATATPAATAAMTPAKDKSKKDEKVSPRETPATTPAASLAPAITPDTRDKGKDKQREKAAPSASVPPSSGVTATGPPTPADTDKADKRKPKDKPSAPPVDAAEKRTPLPVQPESDIKRNRIEPVKPDAAPEKPKQEKAAEPSSKPPKNEPPKKEQAANAPANPPPRDEGKKQKKNEPAASPTP